MIVAVLERKLGVNLQSLIGLSEKSAIAKIKKAGLIARVTRRNKESSPGTPDFDSSRVNLEVDKGRVTKAEVG